MDQTLFHLINEQWTNPVLDLFMAALSNVEIWKPFLILIALVAPIFGGFRARACLVCLLISLALADQLTGVLKSAFDRHRPKQVQSVRLVKLEPARPEFLTLFKKVKIHYSNPSERDRSGPSFPSGHMTNNTIIALCLTLFYPRRGWLYWLVAAAIGYSRVYLGAHWPSDVIATLFLASGEALLTIGALELLWRWIAPRCVPNLYARHPRLMREAAPSEVGDRPELP